MRGGGASKPSKKLPGRHLGRFRGGKFRLRRHLSGRESLSAEVDRHAKAGPRLDICQAGILEQGAGVPSFHPSFVRMGARNTGFQEDKIT
jgi:hypothetical protein